MGWFDGGAVQRRRERCEAAEFKVAICGGGMSGICLAVHLDKAGIPFRIFEREGGFGGTWLKNTYPGSGCDVYSLLYHYSFALKGDWSRRWAKQPEILRYFQKVARDYNLEQFTAFNTTVLKAECDETMKNKTWRLTLQTGGETRVEEYSAFVPAVGQLSEIYIPDFKGLDTFQGNIIHTGKWDPDVNLHNKNVVAIGTGPSAIQAFPAIAPIVEKLSVVQRSPVWTLPKEDYEYNRFTKWVLTNVPGALRFVRWAQRLYTEFIYYAIIRKSWWNLGELQKKDIIATMEKTLSNSSGLSANDFTPTYPIGCKRIGLSNDWTPMFTRKNVDLISSPVDSFQPTGVTFADGKKVDCDVLVLATGFKTTQLLSHIDIQGKGGKTLQEVWGDCARAYKSMMVPDFPNMFILYGPGSNLGHSSIILMSEAESRYVTRLLSHLVDNNLQRAQVTPQAFDADFERLQRNLKKTTFTEDCNSWYKSKDGLVTTNWSSSVGAFERHLKTFDAEDLVLY